MKHDKVLERIKGTHPELDQEKMATIWVTLFEAMEKMAVTGDEFGFMMTRLIKFEFSPGKIKRKINDLTGFIMTNNLDKLSHFFHIDTIDDALMMLADDIALYNITMEYTNSIKKKK